MKTIGALLLAFSISAMAQCPPGCGLAHCGSPMPSYEAGVAYSLTEDPPPQGIGSKGYWDTELMFYSPHLGRWEILPEGLGVSHLLSVETHEEVSLFWTHWALKPEDPL